MNEARKNSFISHYLLVMQDEGLSQAVIERELIDLFQRIAPAEESFGDDVCSMSAADLDQYLPSIKPSNKPYATPDLRYLRAYISWCLDRGVPGVRPALLKYRTPDVEQTYSQTFFSPAEMDSFLDIWFPGAKRGTVDVTFHVFHWLLFGGLRPEEATQISVQQVDLPNMVVHAERKDIPIYREALPVFRMAAENKTFSYSHKTIKDGSHDRPRFDSNMLLRGFRSNTSALRFRTDSNRICAESFEKTKKRLNATSLQYAGICYRAYQWEQANHGQFYHFNPEVQERIEGWEKAPGSGAAKQLFRIFHRFYILWRIAYNIE